MGSGGNLQEQEEQEQEQELGQRLPVTPHSGSPYTTASAPAVPVSVLPPPAMFDPLLRSQLPPSPAQLSLVTLPLGPQDVTMEGNVSNPVPVLTKHHEFMRHALEMVGILA